MLIDLSFFEYDPIPNDIGFYLDSVNENDYAGIVINTSSECFFIASDLFVKQLFVNSLATANICFFSFSSKYNSFFCSLKIQKNPLIPFKKLHLVFLFLSKYTFH